LTEAKEEGFVIFIEGVAQDGNKDSFLGLVGLKGEFTVSALIVFPYLSSAVAGGVVDFNFLINFGTETNGEFCLLFAVVAFYDLGIFDREFG